MIAWAIIWLLLAALTALFAAMELINGSLEWRFWVCVIFILILVAIPAFTIIEHKQSIEFYNDYCAFCQKIYEKPLSPAQEYAILGDVINYNYSLHQYQEKIERWGIFAPQYYEIRYLQPIELYSFDTSLYRWWE